MENEKIISGHPVAQAVNELVMDKAAYLKSRGIVPKLTVILVGNDPASKIYVSRKEKTCIKLGMDSQTIYLDGATEESELLSIIDRLNRDPLNHGILVQLPLPKQINEQRILLSIHPAKDVDCFHPHNVGLLVSGKPYVLPCTPAGILEILKYYNISVKGKHAVVMGRSNIVGKPMVNLLLQKDSQANATVTVVHSATRDIASHCKTADLLVAAMGSPNFVKSDMIKGGVVIVDVGMNRVAADNERGYDLVGDVDYNDVLEKCGCITPVPGGVGPMTIAMLMNNTLTAAAFQNEIRLE